MPPERSFFDLASRAARGPPPGSDTVRRLGRGLRAGFLDKLAQVLQHRIPPPPPPPRLPAVPPQPVRPPPGLEACPARARPEAEAEASPAAGEACPATPGRLEALPRRPGPEACPALVPVLSGGQLAERLGDCREVTFADPEVRTSLRGDGWTWVGIVFQVVACGDEVWRWPNLDCHATILYTKDERGVLPTRVQELTVLLGKWKEPRRWVGFGRVNRQFAQEEYAWIDIQVSSALHATLHQCAHALKQGDEHPRRNAARAAFHVSFRTPWRVTPGRPKAVE